MYIYIYINIYIYICIYISIYLSEVGVPLIANLLLAD
jgi:hypothetical protein